MLLVVVEVLADFLEHEAAVTAVSDCSGILSRKNSRGILDVLEATGVRLGLREAV